MNISSMTIGDINLSPDEFTLDELKNRLQPILKRASGICDCKMSLINVLNETGPQTLASYGEEDQQLISCVNRITDVANRNNGIIVINNPDDHPQVSSQLSAQEREKIRFYAGTPLKNDSGSPVGYLCLCDAASHDLSDDQQKELQAIGDSARTLLQLYEQSNRLKKSNDELATYSTLLDNSADVSFILEPDSGRIIDVMTGAKKGLGYQPDDLKGRSFTDIIQTDLFEGQTVDEWMSSKRLKNGRYTMPLLLIDHQQNSTWFQCNFTTEDGRWFVTARDISEKKEAEQGVMELKEKFKKMVHVSTDLIYELDWTTGDLAWGEELTAVLGYPHTDRFVDYDWWLDKIHPEDLDRVIHDVAESVEGESAKMKLVYRIRTYDDTYKYVMNNNHVDRDEDGKPINIIGAIVDISDLVKSEEQSDRHKQLIKKVADNAWPATWVRDDNSTFMFANEAYRKLFQLKDLKIADSKADDLFDEDAAREMKARDHDVLESGDRIEYEKEMDVEGDEKYFKFSLFPIYGVQGDRNFVGGVAMDLTSEKESQKLLEKSLKEKETLLMEIHHRVKNNLAVVSGMMQLQAFKEADNHVREKLFASTGRIKTMATIHELLYKSSSFTNLALGKNIKKLVSSITDTFHISVNLDVDYHLDSVDLNINQAIPCSLIVNEVVTNVLQHAYNDGDSGHLLVTLSEENSDITLTITDDGRGLPDDFDKHGDEGSLGLELIETLAQQLRADYSYANTDTGTQFNLSFKKRQQRGAGSSLY